MRFITPLIVAACMLGAPTLAFAHPGHDGHELTWDLAAEAAHWIASPSHAAATASALAAAGLALALRRRAARRRA